MDLIQVMAIYFKQQDPDSIQQSLCYSGRSSSGGIKLHFPRFPDHWNFDWIQNSQLLLLEYKSSLSEHSDAVNSLLSKFEVDMLWKAMCLFTRARGVFIQQSGKNWKKGRLLSRRISKDAEITRKLSLYFIGHHDHCPFVQFVNQSNFFLE